MSHQHKKIGFSVVRGSVHGNGINVTPVFSPESTRKVGTLSQHLAVQAMLEDFTGKTGQTLLNAHEGKGLIIFGLGTREEFNLTVWRDALIGAFKKAATLHTTLVSLAIPYGVLEAIAGTHDVQSILYDLGRATATTIERAVYTPNHYKTVGGGFKAKPQILSVSVSVAGLTEDAEMELARGLKDGAIVGSAVNLARNTANEPANICTPSFMAALAQRVADESGGIITVEVFGREQCEKFGMNAFLAVAAGSAEEPKFIVMDYHPAGLPANAKTIGIIGKTITLDTGGENLKPADGMRDMKYDMCGGADVIAVMSAIAALKVPVHVKAFLAATDNKTGGNAYTPGDVYTGMDGKSYEIDNTDAEGRLTLVDAISYARIVGGISRFIDYATLTGAVIVALGDVCAGVVTNDQAWCDAYLKAAAVAGEYVHQLPVFDGYKKQNERSKFADLMNTGGKGAGTITAALFVLSAAGDLPGIHVDIAGTAFRSTAVGADPEGATGFGVPSMIVLLEQVAAGTA